MRYNRDLLYHDDYKSYRGNKMTDQENHILYKDKILNKAIKEATPHLVIVAEILTEYFKTLYENAGIEWTDENDDDIKRLIANFAQANSMIIFSTVGQIIMDLEKIRGRD